jgi:hypothetical protein
MVYQSFTSWLTDIADIPIVPHKAAAEVAKIRKPIGEVCCCEKPMAERIH